MTFYEVHFRNERDLSNMLATTNSSSFLATWTLFESRIGIQPDPEYARAHAPRHIVVEMIRGPLLSAQFTTYNEGCESRQDPLTWLESLEPDDTVAVTFFET